MANPNSNPIVQYVLKEQNRKIEEARIRCIELYGESVISDPLSIIADSTKNSSYCAASWDGITCWPPVPAGTVATQNCTSLFYVKGFELENTVTKHCLRSGHWFRRGNAYWTNFTQCHPKEETTVFFNPNIANGSNLLAEYLPQLKAIKETGYLISLVTLIIAILIIVMIKKLHCTRNILHIHLFASFVLRAFIFLLKDVTFVDGIGLRSDFVGDRNRTFFHIDSRTNNWHCKLITSFGQYFTMANYSWILMEGLYLYNLIFRALFADSSGSIIGYVIMGWGLPFLVVTPWILCRIFMEDTLCWTTSNSRIFLIIDLPTVISVVVNLIFFLRISMVLLNKLRSPLNDDNRRCYLKWAKSTLVLVPLFGVNYIILLGLRYVKNEVVEMIWIASDSLFGSFQGFFVAVLYCFLNGEVKAELKPFIYGILPFFATNRIFRLCFPCREKFLRSTRGRISVCTTLSCSSMYANGLMHNRSGNLRTKEFHHCQHSKRMSQDAIPCDSARASINLPHGRKMSNPHRSMNRNDDSTEMSNILYHPDVKHCPEEYISMLGKEC